MNRHFARLADVVGPVRGGRRSIASVTAALVVVLLAGFAAPSGAASLAQPSWSQLTPATSPSARSGAAIAYDVATSQLVLFGGNTGSGGSVSPDMWVWTGTTWTQLSPATRPDVGGAMAYDSATSQLVLFTDNLLGLAVSNTWL